MNLIKISQSKKNFNFTNFHPNNFNSILCNSFPNFVKNFFKLWSNFVQILINFDKISVQMLFKSWYNFVRILIKFCPIFIQFFSNFAQTFRANNSFSGNFRKIRLLSLVGHCHKEPFKLGVIGVLLRALSKNWPWKSQFYLINFVYIGVTGSNPRLSNSFLGLYDSIFAVIAHRAALYT